MSTIPTKTAVKALIKSFGQKLRLKPNILYSKQYPFLTWHDDDTQSKIMAFIDFAAEQGVLWGKYEAYEGDGVGRLWFGVE